MSTQDMTTRSRLGMWMATALVVGNMIGSGIYSPADTPDDWLRAGQALERVLLTATVRGVAATLMTQPIEVPELRELIADPHTGRQPQVVLRFGYGPPSAPTPRRSLAQVVELPAAFGLGG